MVTTVLRNLMYLAALLFGIIVFAVYPLDPPKEGEEPPRPQKTLVTVALLDLLVLGMGGAIDGSLRSIPSECHREDIYSKCIRPSVLQVTAMPGAAGIVLCVVLFFGGKRYTSLHASLLFGVAGVVGYVVASYLARRRGTRIYGANVRRAGFAEAELFA